MSGNQARDIIIAGVLSEAGGIYIYNIYIYSCVVTYHVRNNYVTYIVAIQPYFSRLRQFRRLLSCVAAMSCLPQLPLQDGYQEAEAT